MFIDNLLGALVQVLVFTFLPFLVYLIVKKTGKGFIDYTGFRNTSLEATSLALLIGLLIGGAGIAIMFSSPSIRQVAAGMGTVPEQMRQLTSQTNKIFVILVIALIKTALAEELLFRGFIAKRLIAWLGFQAGNLLQAIIFGAIHVFLFLSIPGITTIFLVFSFLFPGVSGYLAGYLNEKKGNGSIYPGWIIHGLGNLISYSFLVFMN